MNKETLIKEMFGTGLIGVVDEGKRFDIDFQNIATNYTVMRAFVDDFTHAYNFIQDLHDDEIGIIAHMPYVDGLAAVITQELKMNVATFNERGNKTTNLKPNSKYVFMAHCISRGNTLKQAEFRLGEQNSHIIHAMCMFDRQLLDPTIKALGIPMYSTFTWSDLKKYHERFASQRFTSRPGSV